MPEPRGMDGASSSNASQIPEPHDMSGASSSQSSTSVNQTPEGHDATESPNEKPKQANSGEASTLCVPAELVYPDELDEDDVCPICIQNFVEDSSSKSMWPVRLEQCGHIYPRHCLARHLRTSRKCPMCRHVNQPVEAAEFLQKHAHCLIGIGSGDANINAAGEDCFHAMAQHYSPPLV